MRTVEAKFAIKLESYSQPKFLILKLKPLIATMFSLLRSVQKRQMRRLLLNGKITFCLAIAVAMALTSMEIYAGGGPENVFLVVNEHSLSSKLLANHYSDIRKIPENNVIYLKNIPDKDAISIEQLKKVILEPILNAIANRQLDGTIDYIVYSSGFPTRVSVGEHQKLLKNLAGKSFSAKFFAPVASLTSVTYFASQIMSDDPTYMSLTSNSYYRLPYSKALVRPFDGELLKKYQNATAALRAEGQEFADAQDALLNMSKQNPGQAAILYQLARFFAVEGDDENAISFLTRAIRMGWKNKQLIERDASFLEIKTNPLFAGLVERVPESRSNMIASHGFRNAYNWGPNGMINGPKRGMRYFLSAMLSVTRGQGISDYDSVNYLTRAVEADFSQPKGTFYFTHTKDVRTTTRLANYYMSTGELELLNQQARIIKQKLPERRDDVLGLTCGTAVFDWAKSGSKFMAGAIADNLTSTGGLFASKGQTKCTEFLRFGAAGACGTVVEPYAIQAKFPHPLIHAHYVKGCSLAESYYQSVHGPYQLILVGDALCQPFATPPKIRITAPKAMEVVTGKFALEVDPDQSEVPIAGYEIFLDGVMVMRTTNIKNLDLDTSSMGDGFHELRVVAVGRDSIETRGHAILPLMVDNRGHAVTIETEQSTPELKDKIVLKASTDFGQRIIIKQNQKTVGVINAKEGTTSLSPLVLGAGIVKLRAYAVSDEKDTPDVSSKPLTIEVRANLSQVVTP